MSTSPERSRRAVSLGVYIGTVLIFIVIIGFGLFMYNTTSTNYQQLQKDYTAKSQLLENLNSSYVTLASQYAVLNASYTALQRDYTELLQIARLQKSETKFTNYVINLPKNGYGSIQFSSQYAGYIEVSISATTPITTLLTNYKYGVVLDYPTNGEAFTTASFKMPVLDGTTFVQFFSTASSTVTVNVTLYY